MSSSRTSTCMRSMASSMPRPARPDAPSRDRWETSPDAAGARLVRVPSEGWPVGAQVEAVPVHRTIQRLLQPAAARADICLAALAGVPLDLLGDGFDVEREAAPRLPARCFGPLVRG